MKEKPGYGEGFQNIELFDEEQNIILRVIMLLSTSRKIGPCLPTVPCLFILPEDDSVFVHADTLAHNA